MSFNLIYIEQWLYGDNTPWYGIYLINNTDKDYDVGYITWWYLSDDEDVHKLDEKQKLLWKLLPHSRILVEEGDIWQLDISWYVTLKLKWDVEYEISFTIWKWRPEWEAARLDWFENTGIMMDFEIQ
jgi:hypothetical protein